MPRPLILIAAVLSCLLVAGLASAQIERDTGSRSRGGTDGLTRDVVSRSGTGREVAAEPQAQLQLSPYLEIAANSISFSIKGTAHDVTQIVSVSDPGLMEALSVQPAAEATAEPEPELAAAGAEVEPAVPAESAPAATAAVESSATQAEAALEAAGILQQDVTAGAAGLEPASSAGLVPQEPEDEEPAPVLQEQEVEPAEQQPEILGEYQAEVPAVPLRPSRYSFDEFPENSAGTTHEPEPEQPQDAALPETAETTAEQVDEPEFLQEDASAELSGSVQDEAEQVSHEAELPPLDAAGKHALAFDDAAAAFALPDQAQASVALASTGGADQEILAGLPVPDWTSITIPSSVTELTRGNHRRRQVALTFDDGPHPEYTEQLLSILNYYDVQATFFFVGTQCVKYPQWVQLAYSQGHEIGSHAYDHFRLPNLPKEEKEYQIDEYQLLIKRLCGTAPRFLRPPGGQIDDQTRSLVNQRGLIVAMWDVALNDTRDGKTAEEMLETAKRSIRPGSVILAHDGVMATVELLPLLIEELHRQGYEFVTMSQMAADL